MACVALALRIPGAALACTVMGWLTVTKAMFPLVLPDARIAAAPPMFRPFIDIIWYGQFGFIPTIQLILAAGVTMAYVAIAHHVIDPRFDGSPWQA
jgi:hypothetical protein